MDLRSLWTYVVTERFGRRRPSPVTAEDIRRREAAEDALERVRRCRREVRLIDLNLDLMRIERSARLRGGL
jgi:hypothetical protein